VHKPPQIPKTDSMSKTGMETGLEYHMIKYVLWYSLDSLAFYNSSVCCMNNPLDVKENVEHRKLLVIIPTLFLNEQNSILYWASLF
jgi:hypothetical protein